MSRSFPGEDALYGAVHDHREVHDRITTLLFLRLLTDPTAPEIAGHDPRSVVSYAPSWSLIANPDDGNMRGWWDAMCVKLNVLMGEELLSVGWEDAISHDTAAKVVGQLERWEPGAGAGDLLGTASQHMMHGSKKAALGAFYTPYSISYMMAKMSAPSPGQSVCDPAVGSGGMLLAALQVCREEHGRDATLKLFGIDIDPDAVRLCKLNMVLAGVGAAVAQEDSLLGQQIKEAAGTQMNLPFDERGAA